MTRHLIVALLASFVDATRVAVAVAVPHAVGVVALPAARLFGCLAVRALQFKRRPRVFNAHSLAPATVLLPLLTTVSRGNSRLATDL